MSWLGRRPCIFNSVHGRVMLSGWRRAREIFLNEMYCRISLVANLRRGIWPAVIRNSYLRERISPTQLAVSYQGHDGSSDGIYAPAEASVFFAGRRIRVPGTGAPVRVGRPSLNVGDVMSSNLAAVALLRMRLLWKGRCCRQCNGHYVLLALTYCVDGSPGNRYP